MRVLTFSAIRFVNLIKENFLPLYLCVFAWLYIALQREYMSGIHKWICSSHEMRKTQTAMVSLTDYKVLNVVFLFTEAKVSCGVCKVNKFQNEEHVFVGEF